MAAPTCPGASRAPVGAALSLVLPLSSQPHSGSGLTSWPPRAVSFHPLNDWSCPGFSGFGAFLPQHLRPYNLSMLSPGIALTVLSLSKSASMALVHL